LFRWSRILFPKKSEHVRDITNQILGQVTPEEADRQGVEQERMAKARRKHGLRANPRNR
jgi:hypothetical protein